MPVEVSLEPAPGLLRQPHVLGAPWASRPLPPSDGNAWLSATVITGALGHLGTCGGLADEVTEAQKNQAASGPSSWLEPDLGPGLRPRPATPSPAKPLRGLGTVANGRGHFVQVN